MHFLCSHYLSIVHIRGRIRGVGLASLFGLASGCGLNPAFGITDGGTTTEIMTTHSSLSEPTGVPTTGPASNETTETITTGSTTNETPETSTRETLDTTSTTDGEMCGNGLLEVEEQCDDGNRMFHDGCTPNCELEIGVIDAGYDHTCALLEGGDVRCWGSGAYGQLGYGNTEMIGDGELPSDVDPVDLDIPAIQISIGYYYTCALLEGGDVRCWGSGAYGQLGYGNAENIGDGELPSDVVDPVNLGGSAIQISAGGYHTCALLDDGAVRCWGYGIYGQLGYGNANNIGDDELPSDVVIPVTLGGPAIQISAGENHTCAILDDGAVRCWGRGYYGQLGYGNVDNIGDDELPSEVDPVSLVGPAIQISAGGNHTCALLNGGNVRCWGYGATGRLGYGNTEAIGDNELPSKVVDPVSLGGPAIQISAGFSHTCALLEGGDVRCWGSGSEGQLGYGDAQHIGDSELPSDVVDPVNLGGPAIQISAGSYHTCALLDGWDVRCWGSGAYGQLGYGNTTGLGDMPGEMPPPPVQYK